MGKFRKKPVVVEATQWMGENEIHGVFIDPSTVPVKYYVVTIHDQRAYLKDGDWVITEPDGIHHYPCKPDIFEATYEPVVEPE